MRSDHHRTYKESSALSEDPLNLIVILYDIAGESIQRARHCLVNEEVEARCKAVSRAQEALSQLMNALDFERGGELAHNLNALYSYLQEKLSDANIRKSDDGLAEAQRIVTSLRTAWATIAKREVGEQERAPASQVYG